MKLLGKEVKKLFENLTDEEILLQYKQGNEPALDFLLNKYKSLASKISRSYFLVGGESEDLLQEAMLGLYSACRNFEGKKHASFKTFASLCITRAVQTAVKTANRQKNKMLNESYSLTHQGMVNLLEKDEQGEDVYLYIPSSEPAPEDALINWEQTQNFKTMLEENLSKKETQVLGCYLKGMSYAQIAKTLGETTKSVDNAISRTKRKLQEVFAKIKDVS